MPPQSLPESARRGNVRGMLKYLFFFLTLAALSGCQNISYYLQSINGQWEVTDKRRKVAAVIEDPATPEKLRQHLKLSQRIRDFAVSDLALPDNGSYRYYTDLGRSRVVWNVFAAPALSLTPKQWCFPVAGCVSYRGYFHELDAREFADSMREQGDDVVVRGVTAYSTLGWFNDPLLNTFIYRGEADLAGHIFHELAHQTVYVKNDTAFNESFAMAVEEEGVKRWLTRTGDSGAYATWLAGQQRSRQFIDLLLKTRAGLEKIYHGDKTDAEKLILKQKQFAKLRQAYSVVKKQWGGYSGFDGWFSGELNNAFFVPISEYYGWLPAFRALMRESPSMQIFYKKVRQLAAMSKPDREKRLTALTNRKTRSDDE